MAVPPFWLEKIEVLLLAAHLETTGWERVLLSVPTADVANGATARGLDWARSVKTAIESGDCGHLPGACRSGIAGPRHAPDISRINWNRIEPDIFGPA